MRLQFALYVCLTAVFATASAADESLRLDITKSNFQHQREKIEQSISSDPAFIEITEQSRRMVRSNLEKIAAAMAASGSIAGADAQRRAELSLLQDEVNAALLQAANDSKVFCRREQVLGSNMPKRICMTTAAFQRRAKKAQAENNGQQPARVE